ncbi:MAG: magnesium transporter, partial [Mesorhizobium sp.]
MEQVRNLTPAPQPTSGIVASSVYSAGKRVADITIEEAGLWAAKPGHVVWIGLLEPDRNLLLRVQAQF